MNASLALALLAAHLTGLTTTEVLHAPFRRKCPVSKRNVVWAKG